MVSWLRVRSPVVALLVLALATALISVPPGDGAAALNARTLGRNGRQRLERPQILSLRYGRFQPLGAPHPYFALKLRVRVPGGQVLETQFLDGRSHFGAIADSRCGLGGHKNGGVEISYIPTMRRLVDGVQYVHVTVLASSCNRRNATSRASRTFRLVVR
jgi:hypothetical protein